MFCHKDFPSRNEDGTIRDMTHYETHKANGDIVTEHDPNNPECVKWIPVYCGECGQRIYPKDE